MAIDNFLKLDGIEGEATQRDHRGEIELLSWSWGEQRDARRRWRRRRGSGRAKAQSLLLVHRWSTRPRPCCMQLRGHRPAVANAALSARNRSGAGTRDFLKITLKEVLVTGIQMADNGDGPVEQITLSFGEIGFDHTPQTAPRRRGNAGEGELERAHDAGHLSSGTAGEIVRSTLRNPPAPRGIPTAGRDGHRLPLPSVTAKL